MLHRTRFSPSRRCFMLTVGDKFPALNVPVQQGSALPAGETLDLGETGGKWKIVFFWPKDFTFVCPTEIIGYGELASDFADRDALLIGASTDTDFRSEEHTSELQSPVHLVCRLLLEKKKNN